MIRIIVESFQMIFRFKRSELEFYVFSSVILIYILEKVAKQKLDLKFSSISLIDGT